MSKKTKIIMNPNVAVFLLNKGYRIVDIEAHRENRDKSVFIFKVEDGLFEAMEEYSNLTTEEKRQINKHNY